MVRGAGGCPFGNLIAGAMCILPEGHAGPHTIGVRNVPGEPPGLRDPLPWYGPGSESAPPVPPPPGPLPRLAAALERIAEHFEKKDQRWEKAAAENWERVKSVPLTVEYHERECIFCKARAPWVLRGPQILGCVACFRTALGVLPPCPICGRNDFPHLHDEKK